MQNLYNNPVCMIIMFNLVLSFCRNQIRSRSSIRKKKGNSKNFTRFRLQSCKSQTIKSRILHSFVKTLKYKLEMQKLQVSCQGSVAQPGVRKPLCSFNHSLLFCFLCYRLLMVVILYFLVT